MLAIGPRRKHRFQGDGSGQAVKTEGITGQDGIETAGIYWI
jgi:hypothetical protein